MQSNECLFLLSEIMFKQLGGLRLDSVQQHIASELTPHTIGADGKHQWCGASTQRKKIVKSFYQNPIIAYKT